MEFTNLCRTLVRSGHFQDKDLVFKLLQKAMRYCQLNEYMYLFLCLEVKSNQIWHNMQ